LGIYNICSAAKLYIILRTATGGVHRPNPFKVDEDLAALGFGHHLVELKFRHPYIDSLNEQHTENVGNLG
jgi:hypothetical protein